MGYFKQPGKTKEEFFESDGRRWFRTGDIGLIYPNGTIKIVGGLSVTRALPQLPGPLCYRMERMAIMEDRCR